MEEGDLSGIGNEQQIAFFGFSGVSFSDCFFNIFVDAWEEVCKEEFKASLEKLSEKDRLAFLTLPFTDKSIEKMFSVMKRYCVTEIFKIPAAVTLPECTEMQIAAASQESMDQATAEKKLMEKREKLRQLRIQLIKKHDEIEAINEKIEVLHAMEKEQEKLLKEGAAPTESPVAKMSPV